MNHRVKIWAYIGIAILLILISLPRVSNQPVQAQDSNELRIGERKIGTIDALNPQPQYTFNAEANQEVQIEVAAITPQLALAFTIFNENGALVVAVGNPSLKTQLSDTLVFPEAGIYSIQISNVSNVEGQFIVSVLEPSRNGPTRTIVKGETLMENLLGGDSIYYGFTADSESPLQLSVASLESNGPALDVNLSNSNGESLAFIRAILPAVSLQIPSGSDNYVLQLTNNREDGKAVAYSLSLRVAGEPIDDTTATPIPTIPNETITPIPSPTLGGTALPVLPTSGPCRLATQGQIVNVRSGPSTDYATLTTIGAFSTYEVLGRNEANTWLQINAIPEIGWVAREVVRVGGDCNASDLAVVLYEPLTGSITGTIWHDLCAVPDTEPTEIPSGCIETGSGLEGNGIRDTGEPGIGGVAVILTSGACPGSSPLNTITTAQGTYLFDDLPPGNYCVSITATSSANSSLLLPGGWTNPRTTAATASFPVAVTPNNQEVRNFGWDYQFAP